MNRLMLPWVEISFKPLQDGFHSVVRTFSADLLLILQEPHLLTKDSRRDVLTIANKLNDVIQIIHRLDHNEVIFPKCSDL